tara:strand:- start:530 stop:3124 length:2595 start_codon:yes stop_codon:yes gene_type:complete
MSDLFEEKYKDSIEAVALKKVLFNMSGPKIPKWTNIQKNIDQKDEPWSIFEKDARILLLNLGATYINTGEFNFDLKAYEHPTVKTTQQDAVGYIEHNGRKFLIMIECKHSCKGTTNAAIKGAFDKVVKERSYIQRRIRTIFANGEDIVPIWIIATRGHKNVSEENQKRFSKRGIVHLSDAELDYFEDCFKISKNSYFSFNQFLGMYRNKTKPIYKELKVGAMQTQIDQRQKERFAYTFTAKAKEIMPLCVVEHRKAKDAFVVEEEVDDFLENINKIGLDEKTEEEISIKKNRSKNYQRVLTKRRISEISSYLETSRKPFPNNILVSLRGKKDHWKFNKRQRLGSGRTGELIVQGRPGMFHVIDGQHRLFGYSGTKEEQVLDQPLIVTMYNDLSEVEEAELFIDVNENQKKVDVSLKIEVAFLIGEKSTGLKQVENLATSVILALREDERSPFNKNPVAIPQPESSGILPAKQLQMGLLNGELLSSENDFKKGFLNYQEDFKKTGSFISEILIWYFSQIRESLENSWKKKSDDPNGALQTHFIVGLIYLLERIISYETYRKRNNVTKILPGNLQKIIQPYLTKMCSALKKMSAEDKNLIMGWEYNGIALKRGTGSYPLARRLIIERLLPDEINKLVYEDDPNLPSDDDDDIFMKTFEHIYGSDSPQKIIGDYEIVFMKKFDSYLVSIFGEKYWEKLIKTECKDQYSKGEDVKLAKEKKIKSLARKRGVEGKELVLQLEKGSYDEEIYWLDWPQIKGILEIFYKNDLGIIQSYVDPVDGKIDISEEIKSTFFIQMPKVTNLPQSSQQGLEWIDFIEMIGNPDAHKRVKTIISDIELSEFNEFKPNLKKLLENMEEVIKDIEILQAN